MKHDDDLDTLIDRHLDDGLSADETARLGRRLAGEPDAADRFAQALLLHDRLGDLLRAERGTPIDPSRPGATSKRLPHRRGPRLWQTVAAIAGIVAVGALARQAIAPAWAAAGSLERALAATAAAVDREYLIRVLDHGPDGPPDPVTSPRGGRKPGIDGGRLHVRGSDAFVLVRRFADGSLFVNGSDGVIGWSVPPGGPVHLSHDTRRFRRAVPGERDAIPFLDLRRAIDGLRHGYRLAVLPAAGTDDAAVVQILEASRLRGRGPQQVRLWLDADGLPRRIELLGLPTGSGDAEAAAAVALELVAETDRGADFFDHRSHHAPDRPIDWE